MQRPELVFGPPIPGSNGGDRHRGLGDTYASATQKWLSTQQDVVHDSVEREEDHFKQREREVQPAPSPFGKPAPRRPRPAFLGCHLPIPATEVAETKPFPLSAPRYTADELSLPRPYNADYPHPLTVYASPAVNPASVAASGYAPLLRELKERPEEMMGHILAECGKPNVTALGLTLDRDSKEGCGIPEKFWLRLSSWDGVKVPLGAVVPFARSSRGVAPRLVNTRPEGSTGSPLQPASAGPGLQTSTTSTFPDSPPLPEPHSRSETDLTEFAAIARSARRSSDAGTKQPFSLAQWNAERRVPVPSRHNYAPLRKADPPLLRKTDVAPSEPAPVSVPVRPVPKSQPVQPLSPVLETDAVHPIGAERKMLRKTRPPNLGLPLPAPYHSLLGGTDSIDIVLEDRHVRRADSTRTEEILTPLTTPLTARTSLPVTPRTPLTPGTAGPWNASLSTTFEFSAGKTIWS